MTANKHTPVDLLDAMSALWLGALSPAQYMDARAEVSALIARKSELEAVIAELTCYVVTEVVETCNGNKCREPWCAGCFGEEVAEQTVREAREALDAARAAIAKAGGAA